MVWREGHWPWCARDAELESGEWWGGKQGGVDAAQSESSATSGAGPQGEPAGFNEGATERGPRESQCPSPAATEPSVSGKAPPPAARAQHRAKR